VCILDKLEEYLKSTYFLNSDSETVVSLANEIAKDTTNTIEKAVKIFYWTRDEILYNPYETFTPLKEKNRASHVISVKKGWCVQKACVLATLARALGIPSRLHFADIRNHQVPEKLKKLMGTDLFVYHGFAELYLNDHWFNAVPAFNITMCQKLNLPTVEFDGIDLNKGSLSKTLPNDEMYIEYITDRGVSSDLPLEKIFKTSEAYYEGLVQSLSF